MNQIFETLYLLKLCSIFVLSLDNFDKSRYENKLKLIFDQWPKLYLGLNAQNSNVKWTLTYLSDFVIAEQNSTSSSASPLNPEPVTSNGTIPVTEEPIKKEVVIIHDPKNPNQVEVCMDGQSTFVTMRPHSRKSVGAKSKDSNKKSRKSCKDKITNSPSDSEAYGTGSSVSEAIDNANCPHGEDPSREDQPSRHSRLDSKFT